MTSTARRTNTSRAVRAALQAFVASRAARFLPRLRGALRRSRSTGNASASGVLPSFMQNKQLDGFDAYREDIGWQNRSAACVDLDDLIDAVFDGFESMGVLNNTYVIFSSDNG